MNKNQTLTVRYSSTAIWLHWILAILITGLIAVGWYMMSIADQPDSGWYFDMHKSFGIIAGTLILLRVLWRLAHKPAPLPASIPAWQATLARLIHWLLYACMILMPLTGFLGASLSQWGVVFFGTHLPQWINQNPDLSEQLFEVHSIVAWVLVVLVSLHILAAFKHLVINRDGVFQRMWFK